MFNSLIQIALYFMLIFGIPMIVILTRSDVARLVGLIALAVAVVLIYAETPVIAESLERLVRPA